MDLGSVLNPGSDDQNNFTYNPGISLPEFWQSGYAVPNAPISLDGDVFPDNFRDIISHDIAPGVVDQTVYEMQQDLQDWRETRLAPVEDEQMSLDPTLSPGLAMGLSADQSNPDTGNATNPNSSARDIVFYGMIYSMDVKLLGDMANLRTEIRDCALASRQHTQKLSLENKSDHVLFSLPSGTDFGQSREKWPKILSDLFSQPSLELEGILSTREFFQKIQKMDKPSEAMVQVDVNIYGPSDDATKVGDILTKSKTWLQRPDPQNRRKVPYRNPHLISFPGFEGTDQFVEMRQKLVNEGARGDANLSLFVEDVEASTHRADGLERVAGDRRLKRDLYEHQERALSFMVQRESGNIPEKFRLWTKQIVEGEESYVHRITKSHSPSRPDEMGGGILADEMGMGKSLSILALIIKTLEESHSWVEEVQRGEMSDTHIKTITHGTLVIVPYALLINSWMKEIKDNLGDAMNVIKYHGESRTRKPVVLAEADIVLTTYKTLATDLASKGIKSPLHAMHWYRVVLDEAHNIRQPTTSFYKACAELIARSRWCLTGTPIQNRLEDIGALFMFLKLEEFQTLGRFRWHLVIPFENHDPVAKGKLIMLYDSVVLRRSRGILHLPPHEQRVRRLSLSDAEMKQYQVTEQRLGQYIRQQVGEVEIKNKFGLFQAHLQLRILCNHGTHQRLFSWNRATNKADDREAMLAELGLNAERTCAGCKEPRAIITSHNARSSFVEKCSHILCQDCLDGLESIQQETPASQKHCPLCIPSRKPSKAHNQEARPPVLRAEADIEMADADQEASEFTEAGDRYFNKEGMSTKMKALVRDIKDTLDEPPVRENETIRETKSIIFSIWTMTLNLVGGYLQREGITYLRVDGECSPSKRQHTLDEFALPEGPRVMLMTIGTGAFGLNLTVANRIFLVELHWNPSVENQAISRAIRIGQKDSVIVTRYIMKGTVEEGMQDQQQKKKKTAKIGF